MKIPYPPLLKRINTWLIVHRPLIWLTRVHVIIPVITLLLLLFALISVVLPFDVRERDQIESWWSLFILISVFLAAAWVYYTLIFNVEKFFGLRSMLDEYKLFGIYSIIFLCFILFSLPFFKIHREKVAHVTSDAELVDDVNKLNRGVRYFFFDEYGYQSFTDTLRQKSPYTNADTVYYVDMVRPGVYVYGSTFSLSGDWDTTGSYPLLTSYAMRKLGEGGKEEKLKRIGDFFEVFRKYNIKLESSPEGVLQNFDYYKDSTIRTDRFYYIKVAGESRYSMHTVLENISQAKRGRYFYNEEWFWWVVGYFAFYLTIGLLLFRNVRWKQFLATLATGLTLFIVLIILAEVRLFGRWSDDLFLCFSFLLLFAVSVGLTARYILKGVRFSAFMSVVMQLLYLFSPIFFLFLTYWLDDAFDVFSRDYYSQLMSQYRFYIPTPAYDALSAEYSRCTERYHTAMLWSSVGGVILHILLWQPFFKERFVKLYSLPANK